MSNSGRNTLQWFQSGWHNPQVWWFIWTPIGLRHVGVPVHAIYSETTVGDVSTTTLVRCPFLGPSEVHHSNCFRVYEVNRRYWDPWEYLVLQIRSLFFLPNWVNPQTWELCFFTFQAPGQQIQE